MSSCWWHWGYDFINLKNRISKLPFVNKRKLNKLYHDIEIKCCIPHDNMFSKWGGLFSFIKANYNFCISLLALLYWTSLKWRFIVFLVVFLWLNTIWVKYFNWTKIF